MSEVQHQLLITLVHGTRPPELRAVRFIKWVLDFMRRKRREPLTYWFEEGSSFLTRLCTQLGDIPHKITPILWTGKNSIRARNDAAHSLAEHLSAQHVEHPRATQLIIAHSHGGNIALHALYQLRNPDATQLAWAEGPNPLVVTLATPFVEVHPADFGSNPTYIRCAVIFAVTLLSYYVTSAVFPEVGNPPDRPPLIWLVVIGVPVLISLILWKVWISNGDIARRNRVEALSEATRLGDLGSAQAKRLLIIRAVDDEASLLLAVGTAVNYVTTKSMSYLFWIFSLLPLVLIPVLLFTLPLLHRSALDESWYRHAATVICSAIIILLFALLTAARTVYGRDFAVSSMESQVNTQSTPDAKGLSEIVTLVRRTYVKSLRHSIYDHDDCAKTISDWVRSQLIR